MADSRFDVAVVGGGMVGAAVSLALAQQDFSVVMLEARAPALRWPDDDHDLRVSAITRASQRLFENLGVWQAMSADRVTPYRQMHVWDRAGFGEIHFDAAELAEPDLGHIIENRVLVRALWQALDGTDVVRRVPARLKGFENTEQRVTLSLEDGNEISAGLVVGADGARSAVRELAAIESRSEPYDQHAVVATVHAEKGNLATAWQRFMAPGPLALLPIEADLFSIVWSTSPDEAARLCAMPADEFDDLLSETSEQRLGHLALRGARAAFPLRLQHAEHYVQPGLALVGDAAHVIHPLAGQGVNLGLLDAGALLDALVEGRKCGRAPGSMRTLRVYERRRRGHNTATQLVMDGFKHLFSNDRRSLSLVRNIGLGAAARVGPLRRVFERVALGHGLELPSLCRPPGRSASPG